ncbi:MAG: DHA2 family efflux MFS transporter permease subunit [Rhodocyclaceae bacterium]|jgi:DHA2 family multidrug resistance protein|nr:DHA2 family efflux MFS transporter permease subunit [Rhodocyclaceae bacterium]
MKPLLPGLARTARPEEIHARRYLIAITVTLATVLLTLDVTIVSVAVPSMMGNLGATLDEIAWVTTGFILASVIVLPISSWLGDWFGRRNYFSLSVLAFTIASVMCGMSSSLEGLVFWRVVQGMAGGGLVSSAQVALIDSFPPREVGIGMAIWGTGLMLGPAIGPPLGGWLTETLSWPWIFYVNLPVGGLALVLALMYVPDSPTAKKPPRVDFAGLLLLAAGVGCLQALLERGEHLDWLASREIVAYCMVCPLALALLAWHELRCPHPVVNVRVFANRQFTVSMLLMAMVGLAGTTYIFAFPVLLQTIHGYNAAQAGMAIMPFMLGSILGFIVAGKLSSMPGLDLRWLVTAGALLAGLGYWEHSYLTGDSSAADFIVPQLCLGLGQPLGLLAMTALSTATLRHDQVPGGNGLINFARQLGGSLGVALFATSVAHFHGTSRGELIRHVSLFADAASARLAMFRELLLSQGTPLAVAPRKALMLLDMQVNLQAQIVAFNQTMAVFALAVAGVVLAIPFLTTGHASSGAGPNH